MHVELDCVGKHTAGRPFAYVITTSSRGAHVIAVRPVLVNGRLDCSLVGRSTRANIAEDPRVTLVFPPRTGVSESGYDDYSLVIDGRGVLSGEQVMVDITSAVLHRPA